MEGKSSKEWLVPLTGVGFILILVASFIVMGDEPPSADEDAQAIADHYVDNKDSIMLGAALGTAAGTFLIFFFGYVSKMIRAARGEGGMLSTLVVVGAAIIGIGAAIDSTISFALAEAADDIEPASVEALQALWDNDFMPFALGAQVLWLSVGISVVRTGVLPKWLGWVAIVLGVASFTPAGFFAFLAGALWILIVSVMLTMRARGGSGTAPAPAA